MTELTKEALTDAIRSAAVKAASTDERRVLNYAAGEIERQGSEIERLKFDMRELTETMNRARRTAKDLAEENHSLRNPAPEITAQLESLKYVRVEPNGWTCSTLPHGRVTDDVAEPWNAAIDAAELITDELVAELAEHHIPTMQRRIAELEGLLFAQGAELAYLRGQEPFMYGIREPDGTAYMDEHCVDLNKEHITGVVDGLNGDETGPNKYTVVALYAAPVPAAASQPFAVPDFRALAENLVENIVDLGSATPEYEEQLISFAEKACRAAMHQSGNSPAIPDGWVACSERMPEANSEQEVLACFKGGDISTLYYCEGRWDDAYGIVPIRQDVTHWMSLPPAPLSDHIPDATKLIGELTMFVKRLSWSLRRANPDSKVANQASQYLRDKGLISVSDCLRGADESEGGEA
ncbi:DUF551 domain-containing protein [Dickeya fangzhongdai]|uniref:DUF551 domain-containing protein n=1 Tax=Dickeya fangzhongdai TaxID=1778540 RepID=A0A2K8QP77_9GAMM|nr:DUF551 domain-containing protein [Dickeya fangzhongdai]ATZ95319.1 hypothetical protein CVE23_15840 [Dickeya fangzhongdai]QOH48761.1 DUF551 domain-containing protein [Dickeya fangzhongdai]QOH53065.1 DUF551 domain-containing protein [Dickeya fangzhongdai]GGC04502.1 hypothetical protein GCM10007171_21970 [Dickeya fangzhongdai]